MSTISSTPSALSNLISWNQPSTPADSATAAQTSAAQANFSPLDNLVAWNQPSSIPASTTPSPSTTQQAQQGSTPVMPSPLDDLIAWNQSATPMSSTTTVQQAQQTVAQTPPTILSSLAPANSSMYNTIDSLLGNASTSSALAALAQVNATRPASSQINPFSSADDAVSSATDSEAASEEDLVQSALDSTVSNASLLAAYYPNSTGASDTESQINVTA